jgi:hypothetical protein
LKPAADAADGKLEVLRREFEHQAAFSQVFVVLTVGATLIAGRWEWVIPAWKDRIPTKE